MARGSRIMDPPNRMTTREAHSMQLNLLNVAGWTRDRTQI